MLGVLGGAPGTFDGALGAFEASFFENMLKAPKAAGAVGGDLLPEDGPGGGDLLPEALRASSKEPRGLRAPGLSSDLRRPSSSWRYESYLPESWRPAVR